MISNRKSSGFALIYCRVSRVDQVENGTSLDYQEIECKSYCARNDLKIKGIYIDSGISGRKEDRKEFKRMRNDAQSGDLLITYSVSRFSRSTIDFLNFMREMEEKEVMVCTLKENIDTKSAHGAFMCTLFSSLSALEANLTSERCRDLQAKKFRRGETYCGVRFGYDSVIIEKGKPPRLIPNMDEQMTINYMIKLRKEGFHSRNSLKVISNRLNTEGYRAKRTIFSPEVVKQILNREYELRVKKHKTDTLSPELIQIYIDRHMPLIVPFDQIDNYVVIKNGVKEYNGEYEDNDMVLGSASYFGYQKKKSLKQKKNKSMEFFDENVRIFQENQILEEERIKIMDAESIGRDTIKKIESKHFNILGVRLLKEMSSIKIADSLRYGIKKFERPISQPIPSDKDKLEKLEIKYNIMIMNNKDIDINYDEHEDIDALRMKQEIIRIRRSMIKT